MAKQNVFNTKNGATKTISMRNTQESFIPHWIKRFSADLVSDVCELKNIDNMDSNSWEKFVFDCINQATGGTLVYEHYTFNGKPNQYTRNCGNVPYVAPKTAQPQPNTTELSEFATQVLSYWQNEKTTDEIRLKQNMATVCNKKNVNDNLNSYGQHISDIEKNLIRVALGIETVAEIPQPPKPIMPPTPPQL